MSQNYTKHVGYVDLEKTDEVIELVKAVLEAYDSEHKFVEVDDHYRLEWDLRPKGLETMMQLVLKNGYKTRRENDYWNF